MDLVILDTSTINSPMSPPYLPAFVVTLVSKAEFCIFHALIVRLIHYCHIPVSLAFKGGGGRSDCSPPHKHLISSPPQKNLGHIKLFITLAPKVLLTFSYSLIEQLWGLLLNLDWLVH